jgi:mannose-6-phosphate isomerase
MEQPIRLTPSLRERVWGRTRLAPWYPDSQTAIGEAWFLSRRELPLLVKLIFTSQRLSVQVHPDDGESGPRGKTEMWHILEAAPGATIAMGFRERLTRQRLWQATRTGEVERLLHWTPVKAGERFVPAPEKCQLWICLEGRGTFGAQAFQAGEVWLLPEAGEQAATVADGASRFLRTWVPG